MASTISKSVQLEKKILTPVWIFSWYKETLSLKNSVSLECYFYQLKWKNIFFEANFVKIPTQYKKELKWFIL